MKILHTADWHLGSPRSPYKDGINLRAEDTKRCLDRLTEEAKAQQPDYTLISGDIFDVGKVWSDRCCAEIGTAYLNIQLLAQNSGQVIVLRGTPNHDGGGQIEILEKMFEDADNVTVVTEPTVLQFNNVSIACIPGFDMGTFSAAHPDLSKEERNEAITAELSNIVLGMRQDCIGTSILMAHYTVPGANVNSGQVSMLNQFEPFIAQEALQAADYDLVALGHIHRPQQLDNIRNCFYAGAINSGNFNDEGNERGFWIHSLNPDTKTVISEFIETPYRKLVTMKLDNQDITDINTGNIKEVAMRRWIADDSIYGRIVRVYYSCTEDNNKALNRAELSKQLIDDGAFMVWEILPEQIDEFANRAELDDATDPEENLIQYLKEKDIDPERISDLVIKARPIIQQAQAHMTTTAYTGTFEPVEITIKNYRNYVEETFDFSDISFCTINGANGAGKSSLFMDAILDCLYEEPREGEKTGWLRNDEKARSGSIMFTFRLGDKTFRVTRTRQRSGKGTLDLSELVEGIWESRSCERFNDTEKKILEIIGMDSMTFKSCALIMQDQYGLFLQAQPEERVKVLGTLLGLDVYRYMEKIAIDKGHQFGAKNRDLKSKIEIQENQITDLGDPREELEALEKDLAEQRDSQNSLLNLREQKNLYLSNLQEAAERKQKLSSALLSLGNKKQKAEKNSVAQTAIINDSNSILSEQQRVRAKVSEYESLLLRERELAAEAALYASKKEDAERLNLQVAEENQEIEKAKWLLSEEQEKLDKLKEPVDEAQIRKAAQDYQMYCQLLEEQNDLQAQFLKAEQGRMEIELQIESTSKSGEAHISLLDGKRAELVRRAAMLEDSGCPDIKNASCRFLADAKEAQGQISAAIRNIVDYKEELDGQLDVLRKNMEGAEEIINRIGYSPELQKEYQEKLKILKDAPKWLSDLENRATEISLISASIENMQSNIASQDKRLLTLKSEADTAAGERDKYRVSYDEHIKLQEQLKQYDVWLEKEKQLPLAEERKATAEARIKELAQEIASIEADIKENEVELAKATVSQEDIDRAAASVTEVDLQLKKVDVHLGRMQIQIGSLQQRAAQIEKISAEIKDLRKEQLEAARETADYDTLKMAFSSPGVPHQIIRSIIPTLTTTANSILGQMTGGKMGVEFRLERMLKNGKERTALDIYIEEGAQAPLPYLSKSGGEKVKASLSVILALSEIKSSSLGVQLGMLFIDEPPFLDDEGVQAYCDALETIQNRYPDLKVMAITHDPTMKARFPQSVDVVKTDEGSKVVY